MTTSDSPTHTPRQDKIDRTKQIREARERHRQAVSRIMNLRADLLATADATHQAEIKFIQDEFYEGIRGPLLARGNQVPDVIGLFISRSSAEDVAREALAREVRRIDSRIRDLLVDAHNDCNDAMPRRSED